MNKVLGALVLVILISMIYLYMSKWIGSPKTSGNELTVTINNHTYNTEIADTDNERAKGLSGRTSLPAGQGLLFLFPAKDRYAFWMKDMKFPIDIIWINDDTIVDITENVPIPVTATYIPRYQPKLPVNKVLEINSGEIKKNGIQVGQRVIFTGLDTNNLN